MSHLISRSFLRRYWFPISLAIISAVSLYDTYLIVLFQGEIYHMEENPMGFWLIKLGDGSIEIFVRTKIAGTIVVVSTLLAMWIYRSKIIFPVTTSVASYQMGLFMYLTVA